MAAPPGLSHLANLRFAMRLLADPRRPIEECTQRFGPIWQSLVPGRGGLVPLTWLMGREGNERVLAPKYKDDFTWFEGYRFTMEPLFGHNILLLLDDEPGSLTGAHRQRFRAIVPAFHPRLDGDYVAALESIVAQHLSGLPQEAPFDMQWAVKKLTFHVVAQLLLGAEAEDLLELTHLFEQVGLGLFSLIHLSIPGLPFYRARRARAALDRYLHGRIAACRSEKKTPPPMLANLLLAQREDPELLTDEIIVAELISFLYAGYDTTSSLLTSLFIALGEHAEVYARLRDTLRHSQTAALNEDGNSGDSPYLDAVLLETERLYPPLLFLMRGVRNDLNYGGFTLRAGSKVAYSPYYTHRLAELYAEPLRFLPERFLDADGAMRRIPPYTLIGFGAGHRMCIGKRLAGLETRLFLRRLLQHFDLRFLPQTPSPLYFNPAMQRKAGYQIQLTPRAAA